MYLRLGKDLEQELHEGQQQVERLVVGPGCLPAVGKEHPRAGRLDEEQVLLLGVLQGMVLAPQLFAQLGMAEEQFCQRGMRLVFPLELQL